MPDFQYRALRPSGEIVSGSIAAASAAEVLRRIEFLGLIPIEAVTQLKAGASSAKFGGLFDSAPRGEEVTIFTGDLALLLRTGARINDALELIAADADVGRIRAVAASLASAVLSGESLAEAIARQPKVFPPIYVALVRVGETSGTLVNVLEALATERARAEGLRRRLVDALRYPAFLLLAASCVLVFFLGFVLPQFAGVFRDFNTKLDPTLQAFLGLSDFVRAHTQGLVLTGVAAIAAIWLLLRTPAVREALIRAASVLPVVGVLFSSQRAVLFCRNLGLMLASGVALTTALSILADMLGGAGRATVWSQAADRVRQGGRLSDALAATRALPVAAVRTLRLGEETGQLPGLAAKIADFYDAKLQRSLDRVVGIAGPAAIIVISLIVGGLIVSVMTALLSINQVIG